MSAGACITIMAQCVFDGDLYNAEIWRRDWETKKSHRVAIKCQDRIKKELSICQSLLCLDLVNFPMLNQSKPQAETWWCPSLNRFMFQACDHTPPRIRTSPSKLALHVPLSLLTTSFATSSLAMFSRMKKQKERGQHAISKKTSSRPHPPTHRHHHTHSHTKNFMQVSPPAWRLQVFESLCYRKTQGIECFCTFSWRAGKDTCLKICVFFCSRAQCTTTHHNPLQHTATHHARSLCPLVCSPIKPHAGISCPCSKSFSQTNWINPFTPYNLAPNSRCSVAPSGKTHVFPDDANVHLLERVAHRIMNPWAKCACFQQPTENLWTWKVSVCVFFFLLLTGGVWCILPESKTPQLAEAQGMIDCLGVVHMVEGFQSEYR